MSKHYSLDDLTWRDVGNGWQFATVTLSRGETTDNVASTNQPFIYGPATVEFWKSPNGIQEVVK